MQTVSDESRDPLAMFLADPRSHLGDILYLYFRQYKRNVITRLFSRSIERMQLEPTDNLRVADIGASMGFDLKYIFNCLTDGFTQPTPWATTDIVLVEGDEGMIAAGERDWVETRRLPGLSYQYLKSDLARPLPLPDDSQHIILCSEVVEHLEHPDVLLAEIHRSLRPGGRFILTTDNCPSALQRLRRIPEWLSGRYRAKYTRPHKDDEIVARVSIGGLTAPIYGHINLNPTRHWEKLATRAGFVLDSFGTYESMRRGGGRRTPGLLALYFGVGFVVSLLPPRVGRFFGDTTVLLLRKPAAEVSA